MSSDVFKVPLKRASSDYCFFGAKGSGKTIAMTYFALYFSLHDIPICSNFRLNMPYTYISNIYQLEKMHDCVFLGDDFEKWASSKFLSSHEKRSLLECTLNFGKRNIIFLWSCKRPLEIDKTLRATSIDYFVKCNLILKYMPFSVEEYLDMSKYLDAHKLQMIVYDSISLTPDRICEVDNLDLWCQLYDTSEEIKDFSLSDDSASNGRAANIPNDGMFANPVS